MASNLCQLTEGSKSDTLAILDLASRTLVVFTYSLSLWEILSHHVRNPVILLERPNGQAMRREALKLYGGREGSNGLRAQDRPSDFSSCGHHLPIAMRGTPSQHQQESCTGESSQPSELGEIIKWLVF